MVNGDSISLMEERGTGRKSGGMLFEDSVVFMGLDDDT